MNKMTEEERLELASQLRGSLILFTQYFYGLLYGREFTVSEPVGRESHHVTICKALTKASRLELLNHRLVINTPPGSSKSSLLCMFVAWTMAQYPDSKYIYVSYSKTLSDKSTEMIKRIMQLPEYEYLFDIKIRKDSKAKDYFQTNQGGIVASAGSTGTVTGLSSGSPNLDRWSGCLIADDLLSATDAHSQTIRDSVNSNFFGSLMTRRRGLNVPVIVVGQRLHEDDICAQLLNKADGFDWEHVVLKAVDEANNIMFPEVYSRDMLEKMRETSPYVYASQYQQDPVSADSSLYKASWFVILDETPKMLYTFVVADTAETAQNHRDASALGHFGVYEIESNGFKTGKYGLHCLDMLEIRVEPKDLKDTFLSFWYNAMRFTSPPVFAAIEKKSTGTTLISVLEELRAMRIVDIKRSRASGSKTQRFLDVQSLIAERRISFTKYDSHISLVLDHMTKINANDSHAHDDICDVFADAIRLSLIEKSLFYQYGREEDTTQKSAVDILASHSRNMNALRRSAYKR